MDKGRIQVMCMIYLAAYGPFHRRYSIQMSELFNPRRIHRVRNRAIQPETGKSVDRALEAGGQAVGGALPRNNIKLVGDLLCLKTVPEGSKFEN